MGCDNIKGDWIFLPLNVIAYWIGYLLEGNVMKGVFIIDYIENISGF